MNLAPIAFAMLMAALAIAYISSVGAALLSTVSGYALIPHLNIPDTAGGLRELPDILFKLDIPPIMSVISALVLSIVLVIFFIGIISYSIGSYSYLDKIRKL